MPSTILITGASRGLGLELVRHFCKAGWQVAGCSRGPAAWEHPAYRHTRLDVRDETAVAAWVRETRSATGRIDAVLNNAALAAMNALLLTPGKALTEALATNVVGPFLVLREAAKAMVRQGGGRIVNFTSVAVPWNLEGEAAYAASKAALESLTRVAARELGRHGITVNAVGPGPMRLGLTRGVPEDALERLRARQAIPTWTEPSDVLSVIDFFLRPESRLVTGQVVYLGGP